MTATLTDITGAEAGSGKTYDQLMKAKTAEVEALTESVEEKTKYIGDLGVKIVGMKEDLSDSEESLMEHKKFLAELEADTEDELVKQQDEHKSAVKDSWPQRSTSASSMLSATGSSSTLTCARRPAPEKSMPLARPRMLFLAQISAFSKSSL